DLEVIAGYGFIALSWTPPADLSELEIEHYSIYRSTDSEGPFTYLANSTTTSFNDTAVVNGQIYYYRVQTITEYGESEHSEIISTMPNSSILPGDDTPTDDTQNGGIPGYNIGILIISLTMTLYLILRRKISKL
ncbi:MAG: fibronectin type III domain-containing protein, partial [Promethearchaeota archaeon]